MNTAIFNGKASMTSLEIAELVGSRHDSVKRAIERIAGRGVIPFPPMVEKPTAGRPATYYVFEGEQGKRDSIIVVAQLCPEFTARLVDRWRELEEQIRKPMSEIEMVAAMALEAVRQQKRITQVEEKVSHVAETVEQIKKGTIREGYAGYRQLKAKTGLSDDKCRNLVNAYQIPTDTPRVHDIGRIVVTSRNCCSGTVYGCFLSGYGGSRTARDSLVSPENGVISGYWLAAVKKKPGSDPARSTLVKATSQKK